MRVLLDANVLIRYLLNQTEQGTIVDIMTAAHAEVFDLLVPEELLDELVRTTAKRRLIKKIDPTRLTGLINVLRTLGEWLPALTPPIPAYTRDPGDDYLIAHSLAAHAEYLVTGDEDLLVLDQVGSVQIVSPGAFSALLRQPDDRN